MPKNVMKMLKRTPSHARNDFDLSHRHLFAINFGELLPATFIETVPGDYIELRASDLLRAIPMVTSPFMRVKQHIDVWYTPYRDLWNNFESFMTQKDEFTHSTQKYANFTPHANKYTICSTIAAQTSEEDVVGLDYVEGAKRIFDLCGYGRFDTSGSASVHPDVNLWRIAQYNKVWYDEYRQQYYDKGTRLLTLNLSKPTNAAQLFSFDDLPCDTYAHADISAGDYDSDTRLRAMFQMRYRLWKKDLFTGIMPSTQFGNVSSVSVFGSSNFSGTTGLSENNYFLKGGTFSNSPVDVYAVNTNNLVANNSSGNQVNLVHNHSFSLSGNLGSYDILSLRKSEAIQIWREAALTAGNRISDNMRSHYGEDAYYNDHRSTFLGSVDAPLNIGDVDSHAQTGSGANQGLADVAGKGLSSLDEKVFKFKAKEFGCIMVLISLLPEAEYESTGIDRMNQLLEQEDYFIPEYQDLGLEAVSSLNMYSNVTSGQTIIGYAPRYYGYKQKVDKCFKYFRSTEIFAPWASPKTDVTTLFGSTPSQVPLSVLYVNPTLYDNNFAVGVTTSPQLMADVYFDCAAVRQMSVSGLPRI